MASLPNIQALGSVPTAGDANEVVSVTFTLWDALAVGHSLQQLVHSGRMPFETKQTYMRVGKQMVAAAKSEMARKIAEAADSAARSGR